MEAGYYQSRARLPDGFINGRKAPHPEDCVVAGVRQVGCQVVDGTHSGVHGLEKEASHCADGVAHD